LRIVSAQTASWWADKKRVLIFIENNRRSCL
jgi:hypothetical protein